MNRFLITKGRSLSSSLILVRKVTDIKNRVASLNCEKFRNHNREDTHRVRFDWKSIGATAISIGLFGAWIENENDDVSVQRWNKWRNWLHNAHSVKALQSLDAQEEMLTKFGQPNPNLPNYTMSEVAKHRSKETRIWVAFQSGVYDITDFVDQHPGGDAILMGAGGNLEPFWAIYANHKTEQVLCILESYRIGNLDQKDVLSDSNDSLDPFRKDPIRHPALKVHTQKPFNAEAPTVLLDKQFLTPNELFFVRNHLPVPDIDINEYELEISGHGLKEPITLTYEHLQKLPQHTVVTTIQCAGNRRNEMFKIKPVKGLEWTEGAISTASWTGVRLVDVLRSIEADTSDSRIRHIQADGHDLDPSSKPYGASIPSETALDPKSDVILALRMNGQPIPRDHGYPVRLIVPGVVGARNVKWLSALRLSDEESDSHWQQCDYKGFIPQTDYDNVDFRQGFSIQSLPVQSAICNPLDNSRLSLNRLRQNGNRLELSGYAWSGGGRRIVRVDISTDEGKTWKNAVLHGEREHVRHQRLEQQLKSGELNEQEFQLKRQQMLNEPIDQSSGRSWSWVLWTLDLQLDEQQLKSGQSLQVICKAIDSHYNGQPETVDTLWNFRGVMNNAWHRIRVQFE